MCRLREISFSSTRCTPGLDQTGYALLPLLSRSRSRARSARSRHHTPSLPAAAVPCPLHLLPSCFALPTHFDLHSAQQDAISQSMISLTHENIGGASHGGGAPAAAESLFSPTNCHEEYTEVSQWSLTGSPRHHPCWPARMVHISHSCHARFRTETYERDERKREIVCVCVWCALPMSPGASGGNRRTALVSMPRTVRPAINQSTDGFPVLPVHR